MAVSNNSWINPVKTNIIDGNEFGDNFVSSNVGILSKVVLLESKANINNITTSISPEVFLSKDEYAKKLEVKLADLRKQKSPDGKTMLQHIKERKDLYLGEFMEGNDIYCDGITMERSSFLDRLYSNNDVYRHLNPRQALDSTEKEPFAKHDYLALHTDDLVQNNDVQVPRPNGESVK